MRLTESEIKAFKTSIEKFTQNYKLYLHGSRIDDSKLGGDIDLFLILPDEIYQEIALKKHYILANIKMLIGDQNIDLSILSESKSQTDFFFSESEKVQL
jgi:hypothetical protein